VHCASGVKSLTTGLKSMSWILFGSWRALPRFANRADDTRDHREVRLTAADKEAARDALSNPEVK
jgi:hypothetical protein